MRAEVLLVSVAAVAVRGIALPVTPIGPFCPFRSSACADGGALGKQMADLTSKKMPDFATEMARLQLEMQTGSAPDVSRVRRLANDLSEAEVDWKAMLTRMQLTDDFQSREYYKMTAAWAALQGESLETIGVMMRWQADCMRAFADGQPPLPPPPGVDLGRLMEKQQRQQQQGSASSMMGSVGAAQAVTTTPFTGSEEAFQSEVVRNEYEELCRNHASIIGLGESYGTFDAVGKLAYLDALDGIESRWDVFFSRFALMGALNPEFKEQTDTYLESMGMNTERFREVLKEAHELMRRDAEKERDGQL